MSSLSLWWSRFTLNLDRNSLIAIIACVLFYAGYEYYLNEKYPDRFKKHLTEEAKLASAETGSQDLASSASVVSNYNNGTLAQPGHSELNPSTDDSETAEAAIIPLNAKELTLENDDLKISLSQMSGRMNAIELKNFRSDDEKTQKTLIDRPLYWDHHVSLDTPTALDQFMQAERTAPKQLMFSKKENGWLLRKTITLDQDGFGSTLDFEWENTSSTSLELLSVINFSNEILFAQSSGSFLPGMPTGRPMIVTSLSGTSEWNDVQKYCSETNNTIWKENQNLYFVGYDSHYFLNTFVPSSKNISYKISHSNLIPETSCKIDLGLYLKQGTVAPGKKVHVSFKSWFGPKDTERMVAYDSKLTDTVDLGYFAILSKPLFYFIKIINELVGNWGLAIILFTLLLKILFYPLTKQAAVVQNKMKKLQPQLNNIKEKYKDDLKTQQQEMMRFMSTHKMNPAKGCLPILPQIPVFIAFYRVLSTAIELRQAPFFGWITDLSVADPYYITPILMGIAMVGQQKLMPTTGLDKAQERIMMMLPLFFTVMMLTLPAGMVLYMLTNTIVSIAQQQWLNKRLKT